MCASISPGGSQPVEVVAPYAENDETGYLAEVYPELVCHQVARSFPARFCNSVELGDWLEQNLHRFRMVELHGIWVLATWQAARVCQRRQNSLHGEAAWLTGSL